MTFKHLIVITLFQMLTLPALAEINVFACEPEWKALVETLGGERINAISATTALQDPHHIEARPSLIAKMRNADMVICTGAELEIGWLPLLLRQAANVRIQASQPGYFMAADQVEKMEVHENVDRSMGDVHASGNPHVHLDPYRLLKITEKLKNRLKEIEPENADFYQHKFEQFSTDWKKAATHWELKAAELKGKKAIVYHRNWSYLTDWLNIDVIADLEPKPGLPPSSAHLARLLSVVKETNPDFILIAAYQDAKGAQWLSRKTGIPVVTLPFTIGGSSDAGTIFNLYSATIDLLLAVQK